MSQIKTVDLCERCEYGSDNKCKDTKCTDCELNYIENERNRCKCLLIKDNTPCPHFKEVVEDMPEVVNHPDHYTRDGAMECIDEMLLVFGVEATKTFCLLNAWKYRYRAADKNGAEDLKKSDWYMNLYRDLSGEVTTDG